jgi:RND family efflux transporter MFP subunit
MRMPASASRIAALIACSLLLHGCGETEVAPSPASNPAPVRIAVVEQGDAIDRVKVVGRLITRDEYRLGFKIGGVVEGIAVDEGDRVTAGQELARLEGTEIDAAVARARETAAKAERDLDRARRLFADEVATAEQVEDLTTALRVAEANLRATRFDARFAAIVAPAEGLVLHRLAEPSELVGPGQTVLVIASTASGWVLRTAVADRDVVRLVEGASATVTFDAFPGRRFAGRITEISTAATPATGTFDVEIGISETDPRFASGLVGKAELELEPVSDRAEPAALIPVTALLEADGNAATVFVVDRDAGIARAERISIGGVWGDRVLVLHGLEPGMWVVTDGAAWLTDDRPVAVVDGPAG